MVPLIATIEQVSSIALTKATFGPDRVISNRQKQELLFLCLNLQLLILCKTHQGLYQNFSHIPLYSHIYNETITTQS